MTDLLSPHERARRWLVPSFVAIVVVITGALAFRQVEAEFKVTLESKLTTILKATIHSLSLWSEQQTQVATLAATDPDIVASIRSLVEHSPTGAGIVESNTMQAEDLHMRLSRVVDRFDFANYLVFDEAGRVVAADEPFVVGSRMDGNWLDRMPQLYCGETVFVEPDRDGAAQDHGSSMLRQRSLISVASPVFDSDGAVIATVAFGIRPAGDFGRIFTAARPGESGETFAFNQQGWMLSESRFTAQLESQGKLAAKSAASSILNIQV